MTKKPLTQACKEAKGSIEFDQHTIDEARKINELAALLSGEPGDRLLAAATYLGLTATKELMAQDGLDVNINYLPEVALKA
jgi:xanthine dehydrogenase iron-sulfur cluster and FAD-binding subunit A